ncbi:acetoacetate--CoA ligase [Gammaproteobacteria bacterium 42_54_T18]|nr:acetoacetate--CoA ligase [Gammaproteobacteria bacterium 42_54_T18]
MTLVKEGDLLWTPSEAFKRSSNVGKFMQWLAAEKGLVMRDYDQLWQWSVDHIDHFWAALWEYYEVISHKPYQKVLDYTTMPTAQWFTGSEVNFTEHILRHERADKIALYAYSEIDPPRQISWQTLSAQVRVMATQLRAMGIKPGDRVAAYLPNVPEAVIAFFASASIGAVFSSCSPDFGVKSVIDRFRQTNPKVLFCCDGYRFGDKDFDRRAEARAIVEALPSVENVIQLSYLFNHNAAEDTLIVANALRWDAVMDIPPVSADSFHFEHLAFNHPLWIVYSSGTTGLPKPIVHSHGGIIVEFLKLLGFHMNQGPESTMFFYTTTGWIMWNIVAGALINGGSAVLYDGSPAAENGEILWKLAAESGTTFFGASPTYISMMEKQDIKPAKHYDLSSIEGVLLGGSPATPAAMAWCYKNINKELWVTSQSGGTDVASAFVGASPTLPVYAGEIQARCLAVDVKALDDNGLSIINEVGELVVCQPMPSMPIYFWNDNDNSRYISSYFDKFPGLWCHGDYFQINNRGGCYIQGRSDSTLNRYGVRIGTAEIYRSVEQIEEIDDSIIVNVNLDRGEFFMPLFVTLNNHRMLDQTLKHKICQVLRHEYSPRHVPDQIIQVAAIPYTLTNKKMEVPVRKILSGVDEDKAANRDAMANPEALTFFVEYAKNNMLDIG